MAGKITQKDVLGAKTPKMSPEEVAVDSPHLFRGWRVIDMAIFLDLNSKNAEVKVMRQELKASKATITHLRAGNHWQQCPEKVRGFNLALKANVDEKTGIPAPEDIERFGKPRNTSPKKVQEKKRADEAAFAALPAVDPNAVLDTQYFLAQVEEKLALALASLSPNRLASANARELSSIVSMLTEKRALLRGEPTQIISHEQRRRLDELLPALLKEAKKRGIMIEGKARDVTPTIPLSDNNRELV